MKILSDKKDYYDSMAYAYGIDNKVRFERKIDNHTIIPYDKFTQSQQNLLNLTYYCNTNYNEGIQEFSHFILYFCGEYFYIRNVRFYKEVNFRKILEKIVNQYGINGLPDKSFYKTRLLKEWPNVNCLDSLANYLKLPYFIVYKNGRNVYFDIPLLKDLGVDEIYSPNECYQKIEMYMNNILNLENNLVEIEDVHKIHQHGFDEKSFRNRK